MKKYTLEEIKEIVNNQNQYAFDYSDNFDWGVLIKLKLNNSEVNFFEGISIGEYIRNTVDFNKKENLVQLEEGIKDYIDSSDTLTYEDFEDIKDDILNSNYRVNSSTNLIINFILDNYKLEEKDIEKTELYNELLKKLTNKINDFIECNVKKNNRKNDLSLS